MATRSNPYAIDPFLQQAVGNLTRAFIGSAQDDASLASARASDARAKASTSQAGYYDSQTAGQNQTNDMRGELFAAGDSLSKLPGFQSVIAQAMGLDTMDSGYVGPPAQDQVRLGGDNAANLARTFLGTNGNANQMASAADTLGGAGNSRLAEGMIATGDADQMRRGFAMLGNNPGQYFDQGFAEQQLNTKDATTRRGQDIDANTSITNNQADNVASIAMNDADNVQSGKNNAADNVTTQRGQDLDDAFNRYKTELEDATKRRGDDIKDATERYKFDNAVLEITVEPGKQIVVNREAGTRLGITPNEAGLYVLDGGPKPGALVVKVGKEDVYLTEEDATALGITKNDAGQFVIPGKPELAPKNSQGGSSSSSGGSGGGNDVLNSNRFQDAYTKTVTEMGDPSIPRHAYGGIQVAASNAMERDMKPVSEGGRGLSFQEAYTQNVVPMISQGSIEITTGSNFMFPRYFFRFFSMQQNLDEAKASKFIQNTLGYSQGEAKRVMQEILQARASN